MTQYSLVIASWPWGGSRFGRDLNRKRVLTKVPRNRKIPVYIISDLFKRNVSKGKQNARDKKGQLNISRKYTERWRTFIIMETASVQLLLS